jgi:hypothetical protein
MRGGYDPDRAALVLVDATEMGDKLAARKWGISLVTVWRYRNRLKTDAQLKELVREKRAESEHDLATLRVAFLRDVIAKMREVIASASVENLHDLAGAAKVVGELHQVAMAVDDAERPDSPDPDAAPDEGVTSAGAPH